MLAFACSDCGIRCYIGDGHKCEHVAKTKPASPNAAVTNPPAVTNHTVTNTAAERKAKSRAANRKRDREYQRQIMRRRRAAGRG